MKNSLFGTDGIRGQANLIPMTADLILRVAQAAGLEFHRGPHRHLVVIGKDTRLSGYMLEPALTAGFISVGMDVILVGPLPTPAVSMLTRSLRADLGVMISASHNPYNDNGIKLFGPNGHKLSDEIEKRIENKIQNFDSSSLPQAEALGRAKRLDDAPGRYIEFVKSTFPPGLRLEGLKIVLDCAHGAAYKIAPTVLWELGADIIPIGVTPNGCNINLECGATSPQAMAQMVIDHKADLGIALDGDADRLIIADEKGEIIDGDQLIGAIAVGWHKKGILKGNAIVTTIMSNLGLERFLKTHGINTLRTSVGDRYVTASMQENKCNIGGEPSGHIVLNDYGTTGDGLVAALQILALLVESEKAASEICQIFKPVPQILKNLRVKNSHLLKETKIQSSLQEIEQELQKQGGRLIIRPSGTEPLIRIMAEGETSQILEETISQVLDVFERSQII